MDPVMILDHCNFDVQDRSDGCSLHSLRVGGCKTECTGLYTFKLAWEHLDPFPGMGIFCVCNSKRHVQSCYGEFLVRVEVLCGCLWSIVPCRDMATVWPCFLWLYISLSWWKREAGMEKALFCLRRYCCLLAIPLSWFEHNFFKILYSQLS